MPGNSLITTGVNAARSSSTLRQLNQFGYDVDRLHFVAKDEVELLGRFRLDYDRFVEIVTHVVELIRAGRAAEAREIQAAQAAPLADRLERLTNQLVNKAEADYQSAVAKEAVYAMRRLRTMLRRKLGIS